MAFIPLATASTIGNLQRTVDPTTSDDEFGVGTQWVNTTNNKVYVCVSNATNAAIWIDVTLDTVGSSGMQILSQLSVATSGSYTVPNGQYAIVVLYMSSGGNVTYEGGNSFPVSTSPNGNVYHLGPGATIQRVNGGTLYIKGTLFTN